MIKKHGKVFNIKINENIRKKYALTNEIVKFNKLKSIKGRGGKGGWLEVKYTHDRFELDKVINEVVVR